MTLAACRTAIKSTLSGVSGLATYDYEAGNPQLPCAMVGWPETFDPRVTLDGTGAEEYRIPVRLLVQYVSESGADDALETLIASAVAAITRTLGGTSESASVVAVRDFGLYEFADPNVRALGCEMVVEVWT